MIGIASVMVLATVCMFLFTNVFGEYEIKLARTEIHPGESIYLIDPSYRDGELVWQEDGAFSYPTSCHGAKKDTTYPPTWDVFQKLELHCYSGDYRVEIHYSENDIHQDLKAQVFRIIHLPLNSNKVSE